jgi:superoxide dismutase, Fe-Mn family
VVAALRERELTFRNSTQLHEAYFANLGGDGRRSGAIDAAPEYVDDDRTLFA